MDIFNDVHGIIQTLKEPSTVRENIAPLGQEGSWVSGGAISIYDVVNPIVEAATSEAKAMGLPVVIAVVDAQGQLVHLTRMQDALLVSLELAPSKAYTAVAFRSSTDTLQPFLDESHALYGIERMVQRPIVLFGGGIPLYAGNELIGGLGISGGMVEEDIRIARAGAAILDPSFREV